MKLKDIGEFGFIERIKKKVKIFNSSTILGIEDDAAVIQYNSKEYLLITTDMLLENTHFSLKTASPQNIGKKAMLVNMSDIIAMGGIPKYALISIGFSKYTSIDLIDKIYSGINAIATKYSIDIIGGDTINSPTIIINISMLGTVKKENLKLRKGVNIGDLILVTGELGNSSIGLDLLKGKKIHVSFPKYFIEKHFLPEIRIKEAEIIASCKNVTTLTDISDGLSISLDIMSKMNKVNIQIFTDLLPYSTYLKKPELKYLLHGGEDYELLFTISPKKINKFLKNFSLETNLSVIGQVTKGKGQVYLDNKKLNILGYDHFNN